MLESLGDPSAPSPHVADGLGFEARVVDRGGETVVAVTGEVDLATAGLLRQVVDSACDRADRVVVDLTATTFIDSSGLAVVIHAYERLGGRPGAVVVVASNRNIRQVFEISGLDRLVTIASHHPGATAP
jgi:anti-anti-sigma factor